MAEQFGRGTAEGVVTDPGGLSASMGRDGAAGVASPEGFTVNPAAGAPFVSQVPGTPVHFPHFSGRPVSWVAVSLMLAGFLAGGLALVFHVWWVFWAGCAVTAVGGLLAAATSIFDDWY